MSSLSPQEIAKITNSVMGDNKGPYGDPYFHPELLVQAGADAQLAALASAPDEEVVKMIATKLEAWNNSRNVDKWPPQAEALLKLVLPILLTRAEKDKQEAFAASEKRLADCIQAVRNKAEEEKAEAVEMAVKAERERIFVAIEAMSHPMNTNMSGISLSRTEWQSIRT